MGHLVSRLTTSLPNVGLGEPVQEATYSPAAVAADRVRNCRRVNRAEDTVRYPTDTVSERPSSDARLRRVLLPGLAALLTVLASCNDPGAQDDPQGPGGDRAAPGGAGGSEPEDAQCIEGFQEPDPGTAEYQRPLQVIRRTMGFSGELEVDDIRYFEGPESPPSDKNYLLTVERWYVRGRLPSAPSLGGRWIVERRRFGAGVAAVAPYDSQGFRSGDWVGFQYETAGHAAQPRRYPGLPGKWVGIPYDFVTGESSDEELPGEAMTIPGLPAEVAGCLEGT